MNRQRRKALQEIRDKIVDLKDSLEMVMGEEEEYRDNMPENLQGSEKYERTSEICDTLYEAVSGIEEACENIEAAIE